MGGKNKQKAGVVVYRAGPEEQPRVLLVSSRKYPGSWVFPVGSVKRGESRAEAAARECCEESGYRVEIGAELSVLHVAGHGKPHRFTFFLATVVQETSDWETDRQRRWLPLAQLADAVPGVFRPVALEAMQRLGRC